MPEWTWNGNEYRDLDSGRSIDADQVREWVLESIRKSGDVVAELARLLTEGKLSLEDWHRLMQDEIKDKYIALFLLGLGGLALLRAEDIALLVELLVEQFEYLARFLIAIDTGLSEEQIRARALLYIQSADTAFWNGISRAAATAGLEEVKWGLRPAEHCPDCVAFAGMGWQKIRNNPYSGAVPKSGATRCLFNCACVLDFR